MKENENTKTIILNLDEEAHAKFKAFCKSKDKTMSKVLRQMINEELLFWIPTKEKNNGI